METQNSSKRPRKPENDFFNQDIFEGTASVYVVSPHYSNPDIFSADFWVDSLHESEPQQLRAARQERKQSGVVNKKMPRSSLRHQILLIFGADVTPQEAVAELGRAIEHIKESGLFTGQDLKRDVIFEPVEL